MIECADDLELATELGRYRRWLTGRVLNAGCGRRSVTGDEGWVRLDFDRQVSQKIDLLGDVHRLPFSSEAFDAIVSVAVLEHTRYAWDVVKEFHRVLRPGGAAVVAVPFLQPIHGQDFVRFTDEGLRAVLEWGGFRVEEVNQTHAIGFNLEWIFRETLAGYPLYRRLAWPVRKFIFTAMRRGWLMKRRVRAVQSAFYAVGVKDS